MWTFDNTDAQDRRRFRPDFDLEMWIEEYWTHQALSEKFALPTYAQFLLPPIANSIFLRKKLRWRLWDICFRTYECVKMPFLLLRQSRIRCLGKLSESYHFEWKQIVPPAWKNTSAGWSYCKGNRPIESIRMKCYIPLCHLYSVQRFLGLGNKFGSSPSNHPTVFFQQTAPDCSSTSCWYATRILSNHCRLSRRSQ